MRRKKRRGGERKRKMRERRRDNVVYDSHQQPYPRSVVTPTYKGIPKIRTKFASLVDCTASSYDDSI